MKAIGSWLLLCLVGIAALGLLAFMGKSQLENVPKSRPVHSKTVQVSTKSQQADSTPSKHLKLKTAAVSGESRNDTSKSKQFAIKSIPAIYVLGFFVSFIGWYIGREVSYRFLKGHYDLGWTVGITHGVVRSLIAIVLSFVFFQLMMRPSMSMWAPFVLAIAYPAFCGLVSNKNPNRLEITHRTVTCMTAFGPLDRSEEPNVRRMIEEDIAKERAWGWGEFIGCVIIIAIAAAVWWSM